MDLNQLLKALRKDFPKMQFYKNKMWGKLCVRSNYGINRLLVVTILMNGEFKLETSDLMKYGTHGLAVNYEFLKQLIVSLVKVSNPELVMEVKSNG